MWNRPCEQHGPNEITNTINSSPHLYRTLKRTNDKNNLKQNK